MEKVSCNTIKDILPLYVDGVVCSDTQKLIAEHLVHCESCQQEAEKMKSTLLIPIEKDVEPLKKFKRKWTKKQIITSIVTSFVTAIVIAGLFFYLFIYGLPVNSKDIAVETEFQAAQNCYLEQQWVIHFKLSNGKSLNASTEIIYRTDENGNTVETGYVITLREPPITIIPNPSNYTIGYGYEGKSTPNEDFDFTVKVKYKDTETTYSMSAEGLFVKQDDVVKY